MKISKFAALLVAAGLLSACGFNPPKPPLPRDTERQAINKFDPRFYTHVATTASASPALPPAESAVIDPAITPTPAQEPAPLVVQADTQQPVADPNTAPATVAVVSESAEQPAPSATVEVVAQADTAPTDAEPASIESPQVEVVATVTADDSAPDLQPSQPDEAVIQQQEPEIPPARYWNIDPSDGTVRQALQRWAQIDGWVFGPDQWLLNWDLPIEAPAQFEAATFQEAAQALAQAISLSESPINVCFYGNQVLRVVPFNQRCDRTQSQPGTR